MVLPPKLLHLTNDLLPIGISACPVYGGKETVHDAVDLQTTRVVDFGPYSAECFTVAGLEDCDLEAMADAVRCGGDAGDACADDGDSGSAEVGMGWWRIGRELGGVSLVAHQGVGRARRVLLS